MTMPAAHPRVRYEALVAAYQSSLTTVLRGFRSTEEFEFLDTWVHDDDPVNSLLNIVEAAQDAGLNAVSIAIGHATLQGLDLSRVCSRARQFGMVTTAQRPEGLELTVSFPTRLPPAGIHPAYAKSLQDLLPLRAHEGLLQPESGVILAQAVDGETTLAVAIDPTSHRVVRAAYRGAAHPVARALLEGLCRLLEGRPVQENSDHAVLRLERQLRDRAAAPPVPGIVTPDNADPALAALQRLVREVMASYRRQTASASSVNGYDEPAAADWRVLSPDQRLERVRDVVARHAEGAGVEVVRLEGDQRIVVQSIGSGEPLTLPHRLLAIEAALRDTVERTLQVYLQPRIDENRPRIAKGVRV